MNHSIGFYLGFVVLICLVISLLLVIFNWEKMPKAFKCFGYYLIWNLLTEILARVFQYQSWNNLPLLHIYTLGEFLLFSWFYFQLNPFREWSKKGFGIFVMVVSLFIIGNSIFFQSVYGFNSYAKTVVQVVLIGYALLYFYYDATTMEPTPGRSGIRLLNAAVLVSYSGSLFIFMFSDFFVRQGGQLPGGFWIFNLLLNLGFQIIVLIALWKVISENRKYSF